MAKVGGSILVCHNEGKGEATARASSGEAHGVGTRAARSRGAGGNDVNTRSWSYSCCWGSKSNSARIRMYQYLLDVR